MCRQAGQDDSGPRHRVKDGCREARDDPLGSKPSATLSGIIRRPAHRAASVLVPQTTALKGARERLRSHRRERGSSVPRPKAVRALTRIPSFRTALGPLKGGRSSPRRHDQSIHVSRERLSGAATRALSTRSRKSSLTIPKMNDQRVGPNDDGPRCKYLPRRGELLERAVAPAGVAFARRPAGNGRRRLPRFSHDAIPNDAPTHCPARSVWAHAFDTRRVSSEQMGKRIIND
jgi:hypothetical protein